VSQVAPFPVETEWVTEIAGTAMGSYLEWMRSCSRISVTAHPALSLPAGFTPAGLPIGLQLVGRQRGDLALLRLAAGIERATGFGRRAPDL
jgi:amidase